MITNPKHNLAVLILIVLFGTQLMAAVTIEKMGETLLPFKFQATALDLEKTRIDRRVGDTLSNKGPNYIIDETNTQIAEVHNNGKIRIIPMSCNGKNWGQRCEKVRVFWAWSGANWNVNHIAAGALNTDKTKLRLMALDTGKQFAEVSLPAAAYDFYGLSEYRVLILYADSTFQVWDWKSGHLSTIHGKAREVTNLRMLNSSGNPRGFFLLHSEGEQSIKNLGFVEVWNDETLELVGTREVNTRYEGWFYYDQNFALFDYSNDSESNGDLKILAWDFKSKETPRTTNVYRLPNLMEGKYYNPRYYHGMGEAPNGGPAFFYSVREKNSQQQRFLIQDLDSNKTLDVLGDASAIFKFNYSDLTFSTISHDRITYWKVKK